MGSVPSFDDLNAREPSFFRAGSDAKNITELAGDELELFWWLHGGAMLELDFVQEVPESASPSRSRQLFLDAFSQTKSELKEHIGELSARLEAAGAERAAGEAEFRRQIEELRARLDTTHAEFDATKVELATVSERLSLIETALTERSAEVELLHRRLSVLGRSRWLKIGHKLKLSRRLRQIEPYL
jgi:septation ring formation regulator EzrA